MTRPDVVVVGGGAAGAVLAARLSEDPGRRVLLLEAGQAPTSLPAFPTGLLDAGRVPGAHAHDADSWWYPASLLPGRDHTVSRGRVLGGSTATNGAYFVRPRRADLDRWSAYGDAAWSWQAVLPLLRGLERDLDLGDTPVHGGRGPVPVRRGALTHPAAAAFVEAALAVGHPFEADKNDEGPPGVGAVPSNAVAGVRWSTALTHLLPVAHRPNLEVRGGCTVSRVRVVGGRAVGVEVLAGTGVSVVPAGEVVLSAGALASPVILLRSGLGPAADLRRVGVDVVEDLPGVGGALGDHPQVILEWAPSTDLPRPIGSWMGAMVAAVSSGGAPSGDLEILQSLVDTASLTGGRTADPWSPMPLLVSSGTPVEHGRVRLASADPRVPARIAFGYLEGGSDRRRLREGVRVAADIVRDRRFRAVSGGLVDLEDAVVRDDRALDGWIRDRLGTSLHSCATVPFRTAAGEPGPVDQHGAVRGVEGLRVADTSILPSAPLRGPAATAVLVGEIVADAMRRVPAGA